MNLSNIKYSTLLVLACLSFSLASQNDHHGVHVEKTGPGYDGILIDSVGGHGVHIISTGDDGLRIGRAGGDGVIINRTVKDGVFVNFAGDDGYSVVYAEDNGVHIWKAGDDGVFVQEALDDGIYVKEALGDGVDILDAGEDGIHISTAGKTGVYIYDAGDDGLHVAAAGKDGVYVDSADKFSLNIQGNKDQVGWPSGHIAQIYNRSNGDGPDVLALRTGNTNPDGASNFITFFDSDTTSPLGRIEGNGSGGVAFLSPGGDFAEFVPTHPSEDNFSPGDVVGIVDGQVTLNTMETNKVMVITDRPIVVGNQQHEGRDHQMIGFIGQVPVRVSGKVKAGDWVVASELNDGTGIAIRNEDITLDHKIVGQAWESNDDSEIKRVNTAIGLDQSAAKDNILKKQQLQIKDLLSQNKDLLLQMEDIQLQIKELNMTINSSRN